MPSIDLPADQLVDYRSPDQPPADLWEFWDATLRHNSGDPDAVLTRVENGLTVVDTYDITFNGWAGERVHGWLHLPHGSEHPLPTVVQYIGYGGGRGLAHQWNRWATAGYAHLVLDTRGQGSGNCPGVTPDTGPAGPSLPGFMTRGLQHRDDYYYRRLYVDAVRLLDAAVTLDQVDPSRVTAMGTSQGGGLALAAASLSDIPSAVIADVPFLSHFRRAVQLVDTNPYSELRMYVASHRDELEQVFSTLDYFDVSHLVAHATAPALFAVALMDSLCPPSTVYAAINAYAGEADVVVYPFNDHEGGGPHFERDQQVWLANLVRLAGDPIPA